MQISVRNWLCAYPGSRFNGVAFKTFVAGTLVAVASATASPAMAAAYRDNTPAAYRLKYGYPCDYTEPYCGLRRSGTYYGHYIHAAPRKARRRAAQ